VSRQEERKSGNTKNVSCLGGGSKSRKTPAQSRKTLCEKVRWAENQKKTHPPTTTPKKQKKGVWQGTVKGAGEQRVEKGGELKKRAEKGSEKK